MIICLYITLSRVKGVPPLLPHFFFMCVFRKKEIEFEFGLRFHTTISLFSERHYEL